MHSEQGGTIEGASGLLNRYRDIDSPGINPVRYGFKLIAPNWGDVLYDGTDFAVSVAALNAPTSLKMGLTDGLNRSGSMFGVKVPRIRNNTLIPIVNTVAPHGTTAGILLYGVGAKAVTVIKDVREIKSEE